MPNVVTSHREVVSDSTGHGAEQSRREGADASYQPSSTATLALGPEPKVERNDAEASCATGQGIESLGQIPDAAGGVRRPIETAIWDWDTPLESVGDPASYYYEPQGELMQESRERSGQSEFSVPQAGSASSNAGWPFTSGNDGFAVPRRVGSLAPSSAAAAGVKRKSTSDRDGAANQSGQKRASRTVSESGEEGQSPVDARPSMPPQRAQNGTRARSQSGAAAIAESGDGQRRLPSVSDVDLLRPPRAMSGGGKRPLPDTAPTSTLPPRKVFPIQVGEKLFRLSGASISSDAPSYFTQFFEEQLRQSEGADHIRTLYIDRDPATFEDIALHLQGYHVEPRDGPHFVKLFADAQFFSLPRLTTQLYSSTIYIRIGEEEFQISRDLFSAPGDSPNYFSLGFSMFFSTPSDTFPGLSQRALLRPPSILPSTVPNRSARIFADLLHVLKGYPVVIRDEEHRAALLRDARYFHLKGLEQRLIPHQISYNLARKKSEIVIRIEDIRQSGVSFTADNAAAGPKDAAATPDSTASSTGDGGGGSAAHPGPGWVHYQRPYVDSEAHSLIVEISGDESTFLSVAPGSGASPARVCRATFHRQTLSRITSLFSVIANKMNLPVNQPLGLMMEQRGAGVASLPVSPGNTGLSEEKVKVRIGPDAAVTVDGRRWTVSSGSNGSGNGNGHSAAGDAEDDGDASSMDLDNATIPSTATNTGLRRARPHTRPDDEDGEEWVVKKAQYRLRVQPIGGGNGGTAAARRGRGGMEVILGAVQIEAYSSERGRNATRGFLT